MNSPFAYSTQVASSVPFDNSTNGFASVDVQAAIEEAKTTAITGPAALYVSGTSITTTSSLSYIQLDTMTLTPSLSGNYAIFFDASVQISNGTTQVSVSIFNNGVQDISTERTITGNNIGSLKTSKVISVVAGQIVNIQWKVDSHSATVTGRTMTMIKVT